MDYIYWVIGELVGSSAQESWLEVARRRVGWKQGVGELVGSRAQESWLEVGLGELVGSRAQESWLEVGLGELVGSRARRVGWKQGQESWSEAKSELRCVGWLVKDQAVIRQKASVQQVDGVANSFAYQMAKANELNFYMLQICSLDIFQCTFICSAFVNLRQQAGQRYISAGTFISRYHCLASCQAALRLLCSSFISLGTLACCCFLSSCSRFSLSCSMVMEGLAFSSQISRWRWRWQQLSSCCGLSLAFFSRLPASQGKGLKQSSSDLFLEYMTVTRWLAMRKVDQFASLQACAVYSGEQNQTKAKSLNLPVSLFFICLTSRTGTIASKVQSNTFYSTSPTIGPLIIKLQFCADSYCTPRQDGCVLQLSLQSTDFCDSHRQHLFLLAKFLQSHLSQYQSQARVRSTFLTGQYWSLNCLFFMLIQPFKYRNTAAAAQTLGQRTYTVLSLTSTSSGTLVPTLMLKSVNFTSICVKISSAFYNMRVRVYYNLYLIRGYSLFSSLCLGLLDEDCSLSLCSL